MENTGRMMKKLAKRKYPKFDNPEHEQEFAIDLTDPDRLKDRFSHLLDAGTHFAERITRNQADRELLNTKEREEHHQNMKKGITQACHLPVRLSLRKLPEARLPLMHHFTSWLKFEYGPFHASLIIDDITIEWGSESIVEPQFNPRAEADFQALVGDQGEWQERRGQFVQQVSMADRRGETVEILETLCQTMTEKNRLIERLIDVIVDYNRNKEYHVFTCNCQHFARDAMAALGIKNPVQFNGNLQQRFEQLKRGKVHVPDELKTHEHLDMYVRTFGRELERQDMEYLQCLYFEHHLPKIVESVNAELWRCDIDECMSTELDTLIREQSVAPPQYKTPSTTQAQNGSSVFEQMVIPESAFGAAPDSQKIEEDEESTLCASTFLDVQETDELYAAKCLEMSVPRQAKLVCKYKGYKHQVFRMYRQHPQYKQEREHDMIDILTERERLFETYFNSFIEKIQQCVLSIVADNDRIEKGTISWEQASVNTRQLIEKLCNFPMKLVYRIDFKNVKSRKPTSATPLIVTLQVENVTIEWVKPGLVVPVKIESEMADRVGVEHIVLWQDLSGKSTWSQRVQEWISKTDEAIASKNHGTIVEIVYEICQEKEKMLQPLIELIAKYNQCFEYDHKEQNNTQFIEQALSKLGFTEENLMRTSFGEYLEHQPPASTSLADQILGDHLFIDSYVLEHIETQQTKDEVEYLVSRYFEIHVESWKNTDKRKQDWTCPITKCQLISLLS